MVEAAINKILDHWRKVSDDLLEDLKYNDMATARDSAVMVELKSTQRELEYLIDLKDSSVDSYKIKVMSLDRLDLEVDRLAERKLELQNSSEKLDK